MQKIIHPLKETSTKIMSKQYNTKMKLLHPVHQPIVVEETRRNQERQMPKRRKKKVPQWNPFDHRFYEDSDTENENDNNNGFTYTSFWLRCCRFG